MKAWLQKLHRWVALVFALPLVVVIATGLVLSFEPWLVSRAIVPGSLTVEKAEALLTQYDPRGQARAMAYRPFDNTLTIGGFGAGATTVDLSTGQPVSGPSPLASLMGSARRMHQNLLLDLGWLVTASTVALLVLAVLGVLMGLPRLRNNLSGWHKGIAWFLLPLVVLSPLTALLMTGAFSFGGEPGRGEGGPRTGQRGAGGLPLIEAVRIIGAEHDLSTLVAVRPLGGRVLARLVEDGEFRGYSVSREGIQPTPRNWTRLWHEGNFAGGWSALLNIITSLALGGLLVTGVWIWIRVQIRRRARRRLQPAAA